MATTDLQALRAAPEQTAIAVRASFFDLQGFELLQRVAFGTPDVLATVNALRARGVEFVESPTGVHTGTRGALTRADAGSPSFELVLDAR